MVPVVEDRVLDDEVPVVLLDVPVVVVPVVPVVDLASGQNPVQANPV